MRLLQTSDALDPETIPEGLQNFDFVPYLLSAIPIAGPIMGVQVLQEIGHRVAASVRQVSRRAAPAAQLSWRPAGCVPRTGLRRGLLRFCRRPLPAMQLEQCAGSGWGCGMAAQAPAALGGSDTVRPLNFGAWPACRSRWACPCSCPTARSGCTAR